MTRLLFTLLAALLPLVVQAAPMCVDPEQPGNNHPARDGIGGIGGTGAPAQSLASSGEKSNGSGGIGGTGTPAAGEGGIGGTGAPVADGSAVGIVGVISGFASVCVNGIEVHFEQGTPVSENGEPSASEKLAVGQVVSIDATSSAKGLHARSIMVLNVLEGPITRLPKGGKAIQVLGQTVAITPGTRIGGSGLAVGQMVKVSGLNGANGALFATRIQPAPDLKHVSVLGAVVHATIHGVALSAPIASSSALVKGTWTGNELVPTTVAADPTYRFKGTASRIVLEGLVQESNGRGTIRSGGLDFTVTAQQAKSLHLNQRILVDLQVGKSGRLSVERLELLSSDVRNTPTNGRDDLRSNIVPNRDNVDIAPLPERAEKTEIERSEKAERAEKVERAEKAEKAERVERAEKVERAERVERAEKVERAERIERTERVERVEKTERVERTARVERPERR